MLRTLSRIGLGLALVAGLATPAAAQIVHSLNLNIGVWVPSGLESRDPNDVILANTGALVFNMSDFNGLDLQGEWNMSFGHHLEAGFGLGWMEGSAHPFYRDFVDSAHGYTNIYQEDTLRVIPLQAVVRFLPFGKLGGFQPYVGAGVGVLQWRYSEIGQFVDPTLLPDGSRQIFTGHFTSTGTSVGPILLGGTKIPMGGDVYAFTFEVRYQHGVGTLDPAQGFAGSKIDLSGISTKFGFLVRF